MTVPSRRHFVTWLALVPALPALAGCASPEPDYYRLVAVPGTPRAGRPLRVELRQVGLARYLDRREIVRGGGALKLDIREGERWAEPIGDMVTRVLAENLNQRLPASIVVPEQGTVSSDPDTVAEVDLSRFEDDGTGRVVLEGRFQLRRIGGRAREVSRPVTLLVPLLGAKTEALAQGMSQALGMLADQMARSAGEIGGIPAS